MMKTPTFQLAKNLTLYGLNLSPKSDFKIMHRFSCSADYRIFCNKIGIRLNYTNASYLIKYPQVCHKHKGSDRPNDRKLKSKLQDKFGKHLEILGSEVNSALPFLVECSRSISNSLDINALLPKKNDKSVETDYIKQVLPPEDDIQVKRDEDGDGALMKFNFNSIFSNSAILPNVVTLPSGDTFCVVQNYDYSNSNVNKIDSRVKNPNPMSLDSVRFTQTSPDGNVPSPRQEPKKELGKPSEETLLKLSDTLVKEMRSVFTKSLDYKLYTPDIIFENRIHGKVTTNLFGYMRQISWMRIIGHFKYAYVNLEILKITQHPIDGTIKARWRVIGISAIRSIPLLFTLKSYSMKDAKEKMDTWLDGFSTFYVNQDGLIYKHVVDKMIPDDQPLVEKKLSFISKIAALLGITLKAPEPSAPTITASSVNIPKTKVPPLAQKSAVALLFILESLK